MNELVQATSAVAKGIPADRGEHATVTSSATSAFVVGCHAYLFSLSTRYNMPAVPVTAVDPMIESSI